MKSNRELLEGFEHQLTECKALLSTLNETQAKLDDQKQQLLLEIAKIETRRDLVMLSAAFDDERVTKMLNMVH